MATQVQTRPSSNTQRGRKGRRGGGGGGTRAAPGGKPVVDNAGVEDPAAVAVARPTEAVVAEEDADAGEVCWICAEPVKYYSVSECNHRTCHVCALRLRALYKKTDCTFCKEPQPSVIFTTSVDADFASYTPEAIPFKDSRLSIFFETQEMMEETMILLRFNCPDASCDYIGAGWGDLKLHVRGVHGKLMCDLCIRVKKVFAHEHALYAPNQLAIHLPSIPHRQPKSNAKEKEQIEGGVHPLCEFCRECFFSDDELFAHMRQNHEECFVCKRQEVRDQYFKDYNALEQHFNNAHYPCHNSACQAQKFVVFGSALDLQAHMVEAHGENMSARDKRAALQLAQSEFHFDRGADRGGRGRGGHDRRGEREPPPAEPSRGGGNARGGRRREGFGAHLTSDNAPAPARTPPSRPRTPSPPRGDVDPLTAERHAAFTARLRSLAPNPANAEVAVRAAVRSFRANESGARDLISTAWNVLDRNLDNTATLVNMLVDLMDDEEKKTDLLGAWNGFKLEQRRQFPDLVPTAVSVAGPSGTGGEWAGITSGRVLNAKHVTAVRANAGSHVWDRVAQAAGSSRAVAAPPYASGSAAASSSSLRKTDRFPALAPPPATRPSPTPSPAPRAQGVPRTPWSASAAQAALPRAPYSVPGPAIAAAKKGGGVGGKPPTLSSAAFPGLPSTSAPRAKPPVSGNTSLKRIIGESAPPAHVWGAKGVEESSGEANGSGGASASANAEEGGAAAATGAPGGKGKKGKGKQKQTLFTLGSFPA